MLKRRNIIGKQKHWLLLFLYLFFTSVGFSQLDTEHFLPPLTSAVHGFIGTAGHQVVYLSTPSAAPVNYTIFDGAGNVISTGTVSNALPVAYGDAGEMQGLATPLMVARTELHTVLTGRGIRVVADAPVYCNLRIRSSNDAQAASITSKGKSALGKTFRLGHIPTPQKNAAGLGGSLGSKLATFGIYATENNTVVTIDLTRVKPFLHGVAAGKPNTNTAFTVTLNKGETYVLALKNADNPNKNAGAGFCGGLVTSTKPIAISTGSMAGFVANSYKADYGADQIVPFEKVGTEYAIIRGASTNNTLEQVMVVIHEDNTQIFVNGSATPFQNKTYMAGEYAMIPGGNYVQGAMFIETSKPSYVYQFIMGSNGGTQKTPGMNFVPPVSCETSSYVDNIPLIHKIGNKGGYKGIINIVTTKTGSELELFVDGVKLNNIGTAKNVPNSNYIFYKISGLIGNIAVYSKTIALVSFTGYSGVAGFGGYFSGWKEETISDSANCLPGYLFEPVEKSGTYRWFKDGVEILGETNDSLFATETGVYTFERTLAGCKDTSENIPAVGVNKFSFAGDTAFCAGDSAKISIIGSGFDSLSWATGSQSDSIYIKQAGSTSVRIYSDITKDCYVDTLVTTVELPMPILSMNDTSFCSGGTAILNAQNMGSTYLWSTTETSQTINITQGGEYHVAITGSNGCIGKDTMILSANTCNTDAEVTKTDHREKYLPGTGTQYTIVAKNNGPNNFTGATVVDPIPSGVLPADVTWSAVAHGGATTQAVGPQIGALSDSVDIPVGDSVVYTVALKTPITFLGDLVNTVTITTPLDTFPGNNVSVDTDTVDCTFSVSGTVNSRSSSWQQIGPVVSGLTYNFSSNSGTKNFTATNGPKNGKAVFSVIYNSATGNHVSLDRDRYNNANSYFGTIGIYDNTPHAWTGLSGVAPQNAPILGFIAFIDQNGNGTFDSGSEEYIRDISALSMTPTTTGELYMAFYDDGIYTDNSGIVTIQASVEPPAQDSTVSSFVICKGDSVALDAGNPGATSWVWNTGENTQIIQGKSTGEYTVVITTFGGCTTTDTAKIEMKSVDVELANDTSICEGESVVIGAGNTPNLILSWNTGTSSQSITVDSTGLYKLTATNSIGCSDSDSVNITVNPLPIVDIGPDSIICEGDSVVLDAGNVGSSYLWNTAEVSQKVSAKQSGNYNVTVTDVNGCTGTDTMLLTVNPNPIVDLGIDKAFCEPDSVVLSAGNYVSYLWNTGSVNDKITVKTTGTYYVDVVDANACEGGDTINVVVSPLPIVNIGVDSAVCPGFTVDLDAGNVGSSYAWGSTNGTTATSQLITINTAGSYFVEVTDVNGCQAQDTMELLIHNAPVLNLGLDTAFCKPNSTVIHAGSWKSISWSTGSTIDSVVVSTTSLVYANIIDVNGCVTNDSMNVLVHELPIVTLRNDTNICRGDQLLVGTNNVGLGHLWNTGATTQEITIDSAGTYDVTVTDNNGCVGVQSMTLIINENPTSNLPDQTFCAPDSALIVGDPWDKYLWSTGSTASQVTVTSSEEVTLIVTDLKKCKGYDTVQIVINPLPVIELGKDTTICVNETLTLDPGGVNLTYQWNTSDLTQNRSQSVVVEKGFYFVEATTQFGCKKSDSITVSMDLIPDPYPKKKFEICDGDELTLAPADGFSTFMITWPGYSSTSSNIVGKQGVYTSKVATEFCSETFDLTLHVLDIPVVNIAPSPEKYRFCFDLDTARLTALTLNEGRNYRYLWATGDSTSSIAIDSAGLYTVTVTNKFCETTTDVYIEEFCPAKFYVPNAFTPNGDGMNDLFPAVTYNLLEFEMNIYDRWGLKIYSTRDANEGWDGTYMGSPVQMDVYVYKINYSYFEDIDSEETKTVVGTVTLIR